MRILASGTPRQKRDFGTDVLTIPVTPVGQHQDLQWHAEGKELYADFYLGAGTPNFFVVQGSTVFIYATTCTVSS